MDQFVVCYTMKGDAKQVRKTDLSFRPSVYAIVVHEGKLLMTITRSTGKYALPGGALDIGEPMEVALRRELKEECGIEIEIVKHAFFEETFFYYEPLDKAWQCHLFFFVCRPLSFNLSDERNEVGDESVHPQWVEMKTLKAEQIQVCGEEVLDYIRTMQIQDSK